LRVRQAVGDRLLGMAAHIRTIHRLEQVVGERQVFEHRRRGAILGYTNFSSSPAVTTSGAPALGLTQTQSIPPQSGRVPLVSMPTMKPASCNAVVSASSSWSDGSPPVQ